MRPEVRGRSPGLPARRKFFHMKHLGRKIYAAALGTASAFLALFLLASPASASPPTVVSSGGWYEGATDPVTRSITVAGEKLVVFVEKVDGASVTVTWNGTPMSSFGVTGAGGRGLEGFELSNPALGTHDLVMNPTSGNNAWAYIDLSGTEEAMSAETVGTSSVTTSITISDALGDPTTDELEISAAYCTNPVANITVTGGNTKLLQVSASNDGGEVLATGADKDTIFTNGATACTWGAITAQIASSNFAPGCTLEVANAAVTDTGEQTIYARGRCANFNPTTAWLGAVRIDPIGSHVAWSEGFGPFPAPYTLETTDVPDQTLTNGTWRVRMYAKDGDTTYVSGYMDVVLDGVTGLELITDFGHPEDWELDPDDAALTPETTGDGYTFSASAVAIAAQGGLVITSEGCAAIGENATSTKCTVAEGSSMLFQVFPLLSWPMGIFQAMLTAEQAVSSATASYVVELPAHGDWIPAVVVVDSASRTKGIGAYIPLSTQEFFRSIITFGIWVAFVLRMKGFADELIGRIPAPADPDAQRYKDMHG